MIISFVGHSFVFSSSRVKEIVKELMKNNIIDVKKVSCYLGGYGDFDQICACACKELKQEYNSIETVYVTPYIGLSVQEKIKEIRSGGLYDTVIYPPIENVPLKFAIIKRNEWMMENADLVIAYVKYNYGGAYKSQQAAKRRKKTVINICEVFDNC